MPAPPAFSAPCAPGLRSEDRAFVARLAARLPAAPDRSCCCGRRGGRGRSRRRPRRAPSCALERPYTAVMLVPTGVGAAVGGYAGDALPAARLLARVVDTLVTHPNVLNGALMYWPLPNALYVEGFALDEFAAGRLALRPTRAHTNNIALVLDAGMGTDAVTRHLHAADAARATLGLRVTSYVVTDAPLGVELRQVVHETRPGASHAARGGSTSTFTSPAAAAPAAATFASWGTIRRPDALLRACAAAVDAGADALALVASFPDDEDPEGLAAYRGGSGVDAIAGAEAVISHLVTREIGVPCAHAPALPPLDADPAVAPKSAAEELGYTFLSCVLVGLSAAPHLVPLDLEAAERGSTGYDGILLKADDVDAVVVPADAFGGAAVMSLASRAETLVVAVGSNTTTMRVPPQAVGIPPSRVLYAASYAEAAGFLAAHKAGIDIAALGADVPRVQLINSAGTPWHRPGGHLDTQMLISREA